MADQAEGVIVPFHLPVLLTEVLGQLGVRPGGVYVDGTVGDGGHALAFLRASAPLGSVCGIDLDPRSLVRTEQRLAPFGVQFTPILGSYAEMLGSEARADGVLLDLGISSRQVDGSGFGFSFQQDEPLDMRFNPEADIPTAADIVNTWSREGLVAVLREYGEEPRAGAIASAIVRQRPISSTVQLASVVAGAAGRQSGTHPATRTFQALRIAVNDELNTLTTGLQAAVDLLAPSGRLAVISYHSLEDRRVKTFLAREPRVSLVNRRIIRPSAGEIAENPRSRSARMRVAQRLAE
ncbi:Ribosomal RNA small subunit methyltransferase H [Geodia barretti]|uniref:Ribosomal RNA small subunit methyltransferase H n=1 Tax=Geodia barretti TaxID=519541 RepID=A0AA35TQJ2_GEOBA|nr:Ribosomal RNA small subunit methyltransferase H [Geodia barretti]